jgi:hypothetical protein
VHVGQRTRKTFSMGDPIRVIVERIDQAQRRVIFAIAEEEKPVSKSTKRKRSRSN